jgi:hypothetical protein
MQAISALSFTLTMKLNAPRAIQTLHERSRAPQSAVVSNGGTGPIKNNTLSDRKSNSWGLLLLMPDKRKTGEMRVCGSQTATAADKLDRTATWEGLPVFFGA